MPRPTLTASTLSAGLLLAIAPAAHAAWPHNAANNLPVCVAPYTQAIPDIVPDGGGGAYIVWQDDRNAATTTTDIYLQHVKASGVADPAWPANGFAVCSVNFSQGLPRLVADGSGGVIVTWQDSRNAFNFDIYAQHVLASGIADPAWPANGRALCTAAQNQQNPTIVSDGAGGAIVTWQDLRNAFDNDIFAQRVLASGAIAPGWPSDGVSVCGVGGHQFYPYAVPDGANGAIVTWEDNRGGGSDIYAQHVLASGVVDAGWPGGGVDVCTAANSQYGPRIVQDGAAGAIICWYDYRGADAEIYAQHILAAGIRDTYWPFNGIPLTATVGTQYLPEIISDGAGGALVAWNDYRSGSGDVYAQHVLGTGAPDPGWTPGGVPVCAAGNGQYYPRLVTDGSGGAIVAWYDDRGITSDIYAQRIMATGSVDPTWPVNGRALCTAALIQTEPVLAEDGSGGAIVAWRDFRASNAYSDIYAQRVARFGQLGTPEGEIASVRDVANDEGGRVNVAWNASYLDYESPNTVDHYWVLRALTHSAAQQAVETGARRVDLGAGGPRSGERAVLTTTDAAATYYWEFLASVSALHIVQGYGYLAATTGDSIGGYNPRTYFMVAAFSAAGDKYWLSPPDSGYSVDNVAPVPPAPFTGNYAGGSTHLHWGPNHEADLANYRLYRGSSAGFVPGPGNLVAAPPDTGFADPAPAGSYYKLSAVDVHGNESGFALLSPSQTSGVGPGAASALALARPSPNPASQSCALWFTLPRAGVAQLAIFDATGRRVRELVNGPLDPGEHTLSWDLRDAAGRGVANGMYVVRLEAGGRALTARLAVIR